jgi:hypothetical protein
MQVQYCSMHVIKTMFVGLGRRYRQPARATAHTILTPLRVAVSQQFGSASKKTATHPPEAPALAVPATKRRYYIPSQSSHAHWNSGKNAADVLAPSGRQSLYRFSCASAPTPEHVRQGLVASPESDRGQMPREEDPHDTNPFPFTPSPLTP